MQYKQYFFSLFLASCFLLLLGGSAPWLWTRPDGGLSWRAGIYEVFAVDPKGPAANFRVGDVIVAQDGEPIEMVQPRFGNNRPGEITTFTVVRQDEILEQPVRLRHPPAGLIFERIQPILVGFMFWLTAVVAWSQKPKAAEVRLFFLFCLLIAGVLGAGSLSSHEFPGARGLFSVLLGLLAPVSFHFHLLFSNPNSLRRLHPLLIILYLVGLLLGIWPVLDSAGLLPDPDLRLLYIYLALTGSANLTILVYTYYATGSQSRRQRIRVILMGTTIGSSPLLLGSIILDILLGEPWLPYHFSFLFLSFIPLVYAYAMYRHNFLQLDRYVDRTLILFTLTTVLLGGYILLVNILNQILPPAWRGQPIVGAVVALLLASLLAPLRQRLMKLTDKLLYGIWYDRQSAVQVFSNKLSNTVQNDELIHILTAQLPGLLQTRGAALLRPRKQGFLSVWGEEGYTQNWRWQLKLMEEVKFGATMQTHLLAQSEPRLFNSIRKAFWPELLVHPTYRGDTLWIPLICTERLMSVLVLGPKLNGNDFNWKDLQILETLSSQAAVVIQQVQLIESLSQHATEMDRLYQAVLTAREAERKHLARELHDSVIQDLISLKHCLDEFIVLTQQSPKEHALQGQIRRLLDNLRRICVGLRPPTLDSLGLASAVRFYLYEFEEATGTSTSLSIEGDEAFSNLSEEVELCLFRVLQEALNNVQRHAQASMIRVFLTFNEESVELLIDDDGRGFDIPERLGQLVTDGHFGLVGLRERVETVNGGLSIRSRPERGTRLCIEIPLLTTMPSHFRKLDQVGKL